MSDTYTSNCRFILKELPSHSGASWALECYPNDKPLPFPPPYGSLYIRLKESTSEKTAKQIMELLNKHVDNFTYLQF